MLLCNHAEWLHNSRRRTACEISSYPGFGTKGKCETRRNHLPRARYITNLTEPGQVVTTHWHEEAEFTLITRGACLYHIDLVDYEVQEGDLLFIPPLLLHSISAQLKEKATSETYVFHMNFLGGNSADICSIRYFKPIMDREITMPYLIKKDHPAYASLLEIFQQTHALYEEKPAGYELALKALLLQLFFVLLQYSEKNTSPDLGNTSILDVSLSVGFRNLSYFHRAFKKKYHMTPLAFIKAFAILKAHIWDSYLFFQRTIQSFNPICFGRKNLRCNGM